MQKKQTKLSKYLKFDFLKNNELLKNILFYVFSLIVSFVFYESIPIGAIAVFTCTYSAGFILSPNILLSSIAILASGNLPYILVYIFYILIFLSLTILIKPLVAVHDISEKLKIEKYLLFVCFYINIFILDFANTIYVTLLTLALYKFIVNVLPIIKNENKKVVFSSVEVSSLYLFLILIVQFISYKLNVSFGVNIYISFTLSTAIMCILLSINLYKTNLKNTLILLIIASLTGVLIFNIFLSSLAIILNLLFLTYIQNYRKNDSIKYLIIFTSVMIIFFIFFKDYLNLIITLCLNITALIFIFNKQLINTGIFFNLSNYIPSYGEHNFSYKEDPKMVYKKIYNKDKFTNFVENFVSSENLKENLIFEEIYLNTDIQKWIFYNISTYSVLDTAKFSIVLKNNNILIPMDNPIFQNDFKNIENEAFNIFNALEKININKDSGFEVDLKEDNI